MPIRLPGQRKFIGGSYIQYHEIFDRSADFQEVIELLRELNCQEALLLLTELNAHLRWALGEPGLSHVGRVQELLVAAFADDAVLERLKQRLGPVRTDERIYFHPLQILHLMSLVLRHSRGQSQNTPDDTDLRYPLGKAALMINDLLLTAEEELLISSGHEDERRSQLMLQLLVPSEIINPPRIRHLLFRSHVLYRVLLADPAVQQTIARRTRGFDIPGEFQKAAGIPITVWLNLIFAIHAYYQEYVHFEAGKLGQRPEYILIDPARFIGESAISPGELNLFLKTLVRPLGELRKEVLSSRPVDIRFDFVPFRSKPLWELDNGKVACLDLAFLGEKLHAGVHWIIHDNLPTVSRNDLFTAWGILFEHYVDWLFRKSGIPPEIMFFGFPTWEDGTEAFDGVIRKGSILVAMEYKGGFLSQEAKYSGRLDSFTTDLDRKVGHGSRQLVSKLEAAFHADRSLRKPLTKVPLEGLARVLPVLVVQDQILRGPFVNWHLNRSFREQLANARMSNLVDVLPLNVVHIHELENLLAASGTDDFDLVYALHHRAIRDQEMLSELHNFLFAIPGYGEVKSPVWKDLQAKVWREIGSYLFPGKWKPLGNGEHA